MKKIVAALASVSLLAAPLALGPTQAVAQHSHGGMGGHSFAGRGAGFHPGGFRGGFNRGGFNRGGFYRGGYRGGYNRGYAPFYAGLFGFTLGAAIADSWYYDSPGYYGYYGAYGDPYADDYYGAPPPPPGDYDDDGAPPPPSQYQSAPQGAAPQGQACGSWSWNAAQSKYDWVPC
jgi:hypothetical protein